MNNCKYSLGYFFWSCKISFIICDCSYLPLIGCILNQFMIAIFLILQNSTLFSFYWICCTFHNNKPILGLSTTFNWTDFVHSLRNPCLYLIKVLSVNRQINHLQTFHYCSQNQEIQFHSVNQMGPLLCIYQLHNNILILIKLDSEVGCVIDKVWLVSTSINIVLQTLNQSSWLKLKTCHTIYDTARRIVAGLINNTLTLLC